MSLAFKAKGTGALGLRALSLSALLTTLIKGVKDSGIHTLPPYPQYTPTQMDKEAHSKLTSPWRQVKLCNIRYDRYSNSEFA